MSTTQQTPQGRPGQGARRPRRGVLAVVILLLAVVGVGTTIFLSLSEDPSASPAVALEWSLEAGESVAAVPAELVQILDGDTGVYRLEGGTLEKVRMIGIDAPESPVLSDRYTVGSLAAARRLSGDTQRVFLEIGVDERDSYGQMLAYVWLEKPTARPSAAEVREKMLNAKMAAEGYAREFPKSPDRVYANDRYTPLLSALSAEARRLKRGLWDSEFSRAAGSSAAWTASASAEPTQLAAPYVGNRTTRKLHRATCENAVSMRLGNQVLFESRDLAIVSGFEPCGICNP